MHLRCRTRAAAAAGATAGSAISGEMDRGDEKKRGKEEEETLRGMNEEIPVPTERH